jgi:hypothetical protein
MSGWYSGALYQALKGIHVWELYDYEKFWFPMSSLWHFMAFRSLSGSARRA